MKTKLITNWTVGDVCKGFTFNWDWLNQVIFKKAPITSFFVYSN